MADIVDTTKIKPYPVKDSGASGLNFINIFQAGPGRRLHANLGTLMPGGVSRAHQHEWDQLNYIVSGDGLLKTGNSVIPVRAGMAIYLYSQEKHWYENNGSEPLSVLGILGPME